MKTLLALAFVAGMCGDCNRDGEVTITEVITVVHFALGVDDCHFGCQTPCGVAETCPCEEDGFCWEVFECAGGPTSFCATDEDDFRRCASAAGCEVEP